MKIVRDPDVYGVNAEMGIFVPLREMGKVGGFEALEKAVTKRCKTADAKVEYFEGIVESGEATSFQQTRKLQWEEMADVTHRFLEELEEAKVTYARLLIKGK